MTEARNIQDVLAEVAERAEETRDEATKMYRSKQPPTEASQVYSIRIPVSRLEDIRRLAAKYGVPPTSMLRSWILERLDLEGKSIRGLPPEISPITNEVAVNISAVRIKPSTSAAPEAGPVRATLEHKLRAHQNERRRRMAEV